MQFHHPHFFRHIVRHVLANALPEVWDALLAAGGIPARPEGFPEELTGLQCRRSTFERAVWGAAGREPRLALRTGHADRLVTGRGRVTGVVVDGQTVDADLVIVAAGRASRFADETRPRGEGGACGFSYIARMYRARPGAEVPDSGLPMSSLYRGYLAMVFPQDDRTLSTLIVRASTDDTLARLRHNECFDDLAPHIPQLAPWVDPARFEPITDVMAGGGLTNTYRGQSGVNGRPAIAGVFFAGDAVCTTNPAAGRGVSLGLRQAYALTSMLAAPGADLAGVAQQFNEWCTSNIRPWYEDHVFWDATLLRRFHGEDIDLQAASRPTSSAPPRRKTLPSGPPPDPTWPCRPRRRSWTPCRTMPERSCARGGGRPTPKVPRATNSPTACCSPPGKASPSAPSRSLAHQRRGEKQWQMWPRTRPWAGWRSGQAGRLTGRR
jgi:2-polyprenyl-6-methoxyphenol hydroxylase-like FAD-dependent oxidoreductase